MKMYIVRDLPNKQQARPPRRTGIWSPSNSRAGGLWTRRPDALLGGQLGGIANVWGIAFISLLGEATLGLWRNCYSHRELGAKPLFEALP